MHRRFALLLLALSIVATAVAGAQQPSLPEEVPDSARPAPPSDNRNRAAAVARIDAQQTRQRLWELLRRQPPRLGDVLQRDPSLLENAAYLAPYPAVQAFVSQHPEVVRDPDFFLGRFQYRERTQADRAEEILQMVVIGIGGLTTLGACLGVFMWLVRTIADHRRWVQQSRVQTDVQAKLLDRLSSNDELLAYLQTAGGQRLLQSAPVGPNGETRSGAAPLSRIVLSLQAGMVLVAFGLGLHSIESRVAGELAEGFSIIGTLVFSLGMGFGVSSIVAYLLSGIFGLLNLRRS